MYCGKCGSFNDDGGKFCASCGAPLGGASVNVVLNNAVSEDAAAQEGAANAQGYAQAQGQAMGNNQADGQNPGFAQGQPYNPNAQYTQNNQYNQYGSGGYVPGQPPKKQSFIDKLGKTKFFALCGAAAALIIIIVVIIVAAATHKTRIDVSDYVTVTVSGADGYGTVSVSGLYDWEEDAFDLIYKKYKTTSDKFYNAVYSVYDISITYEADPSESISNGDTVTVTITIDDEDAQDLPFKLKASTIKVDVEGLTEVTEIDLFDYLEVSYSGIAPYAYASVSADCDFAYLYFYTDDYEYLDNGDTFTVYVDYDEEELLEAGYVAASDSATITVEGLDSYILSLDDVPDEALEKMKSQAEDEFNAHVASSWDDEDEAVNDIEFLGCYFLHVKESSSWYSNVNEIYLVYKVSAWNESDGDFTYYTTYSFEDLIMLSDGNYSIDLDGCSRTYNTIYYESWYYYYGYKTLDSAFSDCVTSNIDDYEYESSVTETE